MKIVYDDLAEFTEVRLRCENTRKKSMCKYCPFSDRCEIDNEENLHTMCCEFYKGVEQMNEYQTLMYEIADSFLTILYELGVVATKVILCITVPLWLVPYIFYLSKKKGVEQK